MYVVSDKFKSAIESTSRSMSCKAYLRGIEFSVDKILKLDIEDNINNGDYFTIGEVPSRSLTIEMIGVQGLVEGDEIKPYYGVEVSPGKFEYVPCGVFYVDSLTINKDKISVTCYDKMLSLEDEYTPNIAIPVTLTEIMNDICQQKGIEFEGELPNITLSKSIKGYSYREMIGFIASFCGGNAKFNRLGKLVIQRYAQTGKVVNPNVCANFEHKDVYAVSAIACKFGDVANTRGDSSANCVNFTNPYVDDSNIDSIFNLLNGLTFTAANFKYKGDPSVDSGDLITVHDIKGTAHTVLISTQSFTFGGGLSSEITSIGEGKGANAYKQYKFKNKKTITELNVELGLMQGIISEVQEKQEDTYTKTETETLIEAKAGEISLSVAKNEVNNLQIGGANLLLNSDTKKQLDRAEIGRYNQISYKTIDSYANRILSQDTTFSLSFTVDRTGNMEFECFDTIAFDNGWYYRWARADIDKITFIQGSTYKFVMKPKTLPKGTPISDKLTFIAESYYGGGLFYDVMLVEGDKAFDWQPTFSDVRNSIAQIDIKANEINQSVEEVKQVANKIEDLEYLCKTVGVELMPQGFKYNIHDGYTARQGNFNYAEGFYIWMGSGTWLTTDYIEVDRRQPITCYAKVVSWGEGRIYVGVEQYRRDGSSWENEQCLYLMCQSNNDYYVDYEGHHEFYLYLHPDCLHPETCKIKLRILTNWDNNSNWGNCGLLDIQFRTLKSDLLSVQESMTKSKINQLSDRITHEVNDIRGNYVQNSTFTQTVNDFTFKLQNSGGYNAIRNGDARSGQDHWNPYWLPSASWGVRNDSWTSYKNAFQIHNANSVDGLENCIYQNIETQVGKTYTLSMLVSGHRGRNYGVVVNGSGTTWIASTDSVTDGYGGVDVSGWKRVSCTFVATENTMQIRLVSVAVDINAHGWFREVQVEEGHIPTHYSPHPEEIYSGVTKIDNTGITVTHSSDSSYSHMGANGFEFYSHGSGHRYHNLMKQGWIDTISFGGIGANGWSATITLPPEFRNKPFSVIPAITYVGCPHVADAVKMFEINIPHGEVNYANGTFKIYIYASGLWAEGLSTTYSVEVRATWVAIA